MDDRMSPAGPGIVDVNPCRAAVVWARVTFAEIPSHQRSAIAQVDAALVQAGLSIDGVRLTFSRAPDRDTLDIAPGRMISTTAAAVDDVTVEVIPAGRAAHLTFPGAYTGLAQAWRVLGGWVGQQGLRPSGPCWEVYTDLTAPVTDLYIMLGR